MKVKVTTLIPMPTARVNHNTNSKGYFDSVEALSSKQSSNGMYSTKYSFVHSSVDCMDNIPNDDVPGTFHPVAAMSSDPSPRPLSDAEEESVMRFAPSNSLDVHNFSKAMPTSYRVANVRHMILDFKSLRSFK